MEASEVVRRALTAVQQSILYSETDSLMEIDRIVIALCRSAAELGEFLSAVFVNDDDSSISALRELHLCMNHVVIEWEARSAGTQMTSSGRPRKMINIPMVTKLILYTFLKLNSKKVAMYVFFWYV